LRKITYFIIPLVLGILIASCEKDDTSVIDPILTFATIDSFKINPLQIDDSRVNVEFTAYVSSVDPISNVTVEIKNPDGVVIGNINLTGSNNIFTGNYDSLQSQPTKAKWF
jgi:hypothetical protein